MRTPCFVHFSSGHRSSQLHTTKMTWLRWWDEGVKNRYSPRLTRDILMGKGYFLSESSKWFKKYSKSLLSRKFEFSAQESDLEYFLSCIKLSYKKLPLPSAFFFLRSNDISGKNIVYKIITYRYILKNIKITPWYLARKMGIWKPCFLFPPKQFLWQQRRPQLVAIPKEKHCHNPRRTFLEWNKRLFSRAA